MNWTGLQSWIEAAAILSFLVIDFPKSTFSLQRLIASCGWHIPQLTDGHELLLIVDTPFRYPLEELPSTAPSF